MSRIGKLPIKLGDKVKAVVQGNKINFEGPKGKLSIDLPVAAIKVEVKGSEIIITRPSDHRTHRAAHGLTRAILANAAKGVGTGWERALAIRERALGPDHPEVAQVLTNLGSFVNRQSLSVAISGNSIGVRRSPIPVMRNGREAKHAGTSAPTASAISSKRARGSPIAPR